METAVDVKTWQGLEELREGLKGFLVRHCRDESEAEDVIQESFIRAARYRKKLSSPERLRSWIIRIALNVLADIRRRGSWMVCASTAEGLLASVEAREGYPTERISEPQFKVGRWTLSRDAAMTHLAGAVASLREDDQRVLGSFYGGRGSCSATAVECDIPAHLVKVRLFRARRRLLLAVRRNLALEPVQGVAS